MDKNMKPIRNIIGFPNHYMSNGYKSSFTGKIKTQFEDNSMKKPNYLLKVQQNMLENLNKVHQLVSERREYHRNLEERIESYYKEVNNYNLKVERDYALESRMNQAAIKIQKVIKGFLLRKHIEQE